MGLAYFSYIWLYDTTDVSYDIYIYHMYKAI
jgi:hypothetical protein